MNGSACTIGLSLGTIAQIADKNRLTRASPRLKDAQIPAEDVRRLYIEILVILRTIFARCKLVHADFSEYNIL